MEAEGGETEKERERGSEIWRCNIDGFEGGKGIHT